MGLLKLFLRTVFAVAAWLAFVSLAHAQSIGIGSGLAGTIGGGARAAGSLGSTAARHGNLGSQSTVIPDGMGGFTMYNRDGSASRYLGKSQGNRVYHRGGSSSLVIDDSKGDYTIYGPHGTHRLLPNPQRLGFVIDANQYSSASRRLETQEGWEGPCGEYPQRVESGHSQSSFNKTLFVGRKMGGCR